MINIGPWCKWKAYWSPKPLMTDRTRLDLFEPFGVMAAHLTLTQGMSVRIRQGLPGFMKIIRAVSLCGHGSGSKPRRCSFDSSTAHFFCTYGLAADTVCKTVWDSSNPSTHSAVWCNGNTRNFGFRDIGSNPMTAAFVPFVL